MKNNNENDLKIETPTLSCKSIIADKKALMRECKRSLEYLYKIIVESLNKKRD